VNERQPGESVNSTFNAKQLEAEIQLIAIWSHRSELSKNKKPVGQLRSSWYNSTLATVRNEQSLMSTLLWNVNIGKYKAQS
jgi:hypothetical protein